MRRIIGIEIGASRIVVAVADEDGFARAILGADGSWSSAVDPARNIAGPSAREMADLGGALVERWKWSLDVLGSSKDAARRALAAVRSAIADRGAGDPELTVVAVSTGYGDGRTEALVNALAAEGYPAIRVMDECCATAFGVGRSWLRARGLVIDLGARHCAASVVALSGERITAVASEGSEEVYLDQVTDGVVRELVDSVERAEGVGACDHATVRALRRDVEDALDRRRTPGPLQVRAPSLRGVLRAADAPVLAVDESVLLWLREEALLKAHELAEAVMARAEVAAADIGRVWLTGACARDESMRAALAAHLRREVLVAPVDLVACGAARFGAELLGRISHTPLPIIPGASVRPVAPPTPDLSGIAAMIEVDRGRHLSSMAPEPLHAAEAPEIPRAPVVPAVEAEVEADEAPDERTVITHPPRALTQSGLHRARVLDGEDTGEERRAASETGRSSSPPSARRLPTQGSFRGPRSAVEILGMPLTRSPTDEELVRPYLPVLVLQLATAHATGILTLNRASEEARVLFSNGGACVSALDRPRVQRVLEWTEGTFRWSSAPVLPAAAKLRTPVLPIVAAGLRDVLRGVSDASVLASFGPRIALAPSVIPERRRRAATLGLIDAEMRAVDHILDGSRDVPALLSEGYLGRLTMMRLLVLLEAFGVLRWSPAAGRTAETPAQNLARRLAHMDHEDSFTVLGLHWTATHDEVIAAWQRFQREYGPGGRWSGVDAGTAAKVLACGAAAWERLRDDRRRVQYRHELHPTVDEAMLSTVVFAQAELLAFRGEEQEARSLRSLAVEMASSAPPGPAKGH